MALVYKQGVHLAKVQGRIREFVLNFCKERKEANACLFRISELQQYVADSMNGQVAPASPDRILRYLKAGSLVNYVVEDRAKSLYRLL